MLSLDAGRESDVTKLSLQRYGRHILPVFERTFRTFERVGGDDSVPYGAGDVGIGGGGGGGAGGDAIFGSGGSGSDAGGGGNGAGGASALPASGGSTLHFITRLSENLRVPVFWHVEKGEYSNPYSWRGFDLAPSALLPTTTGKSWSRVKGGRERERERERAREGRHVLESAGERVSEWVVSSNETCTGNVLFGGNHTRWFYASERPST
jgi:hypothetical protein